MLHYQKSAAMLLLLTLPCLSLFAQDLFFKYTWNNFLHFQVELCVAAILNHPSSDERPGPGLQNHDGTSAATNSDGQEEGGEVGSTSDPQASVHNALVAHVSLLHSFMRQICLSSLEVVDSSFLNLSAYLVHVSV